MYVPFSKRNALPDLAFKQLKTSKSKMTARFLPPH